MRGIKQKLEDYLEIVEDEGNWDGEGIRVTPQFLALLIRLAIAVTDTGAAYDDRDSVFYDYYNLTEYLRETSND